MTAEQERPPEPAQLPVAPHLIRAAAIDELERVAAFVEGLTPEQWERPSAASGWSIGDVVAHLELSFGVQGRVLDAMTSGKVSESTWKTIGRMTRAVAPMASPAFHAINSAVPRLMDVTFSRDTIKNRFGGAARGLEERLKKVGPNDYTRPVHWLGTPWPLSFFLAHIMNEVSIHGWDMRAGLDTQAALDQEARSVLPWYYWSGTPFMLQAPKTVTGTVQVRLSEPEATMWWTLSPDGPREGTGEISNAGVTLTGQGGNFVLTLAGRISALDALRFAGFQVEGDAELARTFLSSWKIV